MADFCKECARLLFGQEMPCDLHGLTSVEGWAAGKAASAICEGCGPIQVDPEGNCVTQDCLEAGKPGHGLPWVDQVKKPTKVLIVDGSQLGAEHIAAMLVSSAEGAPGVHFTGHRQLERDHHRVPDDFHEQLQGEFSVSNIPQVSVDIVGRPMQELRRASDRIAYSGTATPTGDTTMEYQTAAWPVPVVCTRYAKPDAPNHNRIPEGQTLFIFRAGRVVVPQEGRSWGAKAKQAILDLVLADPVGHRAFTAHHGNPVIYEASDRQLKADAQFLALCNAIMQNQLPQYEVISVFAAGDHTGESCHVLAKEKVGETQGAQH